MGAEPRGQPRRHVVRQRQLAELDVRRVPNGEVAQRTTAEVLGKKLRVRVLWLDVLEAGVEQLAANTNVVIEPLEPRRGIQHGGQTPVAEEGEGVGQRSR